MHNFEPKILIIKPSSMGDIIHGLEIAHAIKCQWPKCRIDWVVREIFAPLVKASKDVDRVIVFRRHGGLRGFGELAGQIRATRYDWVLDLQGLARSALMTLAANSCHKIGRSDAREGARWAYNDLVALPSTDTPSHALEILQEFLPRLGLRNALSRPLSFKDEEHPLPPEDSILIFPHSRRAEKQWPYFKALTTLLLNLDLRGPVVWLGTGDISEVDHAWPANRFINLVNRLPLQALPATISASRLVISNDSGPMHLAAAMSKEVLALFGPTSPKSYGPYPLDDPKHHVLEAPESDLAKLSAEEVFEAVLTILSR